MFQNERDYQPAVNALTPVLHDLPGKIVAIDGLPGVGKTTLGRYLAYRFNISLVETDLFLIPRQGSMVYREECINLVIGKRLDRGDRDWRRPVLIEGSTVLRLLASLGREPDFIIYVINNDAPESDGTLADDLSRYQAEFTPAARANICLDFTAKSEMRLV